MTTKFQMLRLSVVALVASLFYPAIAHAHPGVGISGEWFAGFSHPLGGIDHLCAMLGVGLWAAQRGGRAIWLVPLAFVLVMVAGGLLGMTGVAVPWVESGIVASLLVLGVLVAAAVRLPLVASVLIVGLFAIFHGHAHGTEMPGTFAGLGFVAGTALLVASGVGLGLAVRQQNADWISRTAGAAIATCGLVLVCVP